MKYRIKNYLPTQTFFLLFPAFLLVMHKPKSKCGHTPGVLGFCKIEIGFILTGITNFSSRQFWARWKICHSNSLLQYCSTEAESGGNWREGQRKLLYEEKLHQTHFLWENEIEVALKRIISLTACFSSRQTAEHSFIHLLLCREKRQLSSCV